MGALEAAIYSDLKQNLDVKASIMQNSILRAIAAMGQKPTIRVNAQMDEATYNTIQKTATNYIISGASPDNQLTQYYTTSASYVLHYGITATAARSGIRFSAHCGGGSGNYSIGYTINSTNVNDVVTMYSGAVQKTLEDYTIAIANGDVVRIWGKSNDGQYAYISEVYLLGGTTSGTIKSNAIAADANLIRYFEKLKMNLSKGTSTHATPQQIKIFGSADSYAAALNSNWVTIPEAEYAELLLERKIVKTATGNGQTIWDFTSLTNTDALINEIGCQYVLLVEQANDGSTYSILTENVDYYIDLTLRTAPRISLVSGTGVVSGTSKIRATMVVDVLKIDAATKNTGIKIQIQENRTNSSETSPSIQPLPVATTQYISADYVARY